MTKRDLVLAALAPAGGKPHSPVQVQKLLFLLDREAADLVGGPYFDFQPYDYGPFDKRVYSVLEGLDVAELVTIRSDGWKRSYALTPAGQRKGEQLLEQLPAQAKRYIRRASAFVRELNFIELVSAIYQQYPEMRQNSVIRSS